MAHKCFACGIEKDPAVKVTYPYNGENDTLTQEVPIPQLLAVECQGENLPGGRWDFRMAVMCHDCWHRLAENTQGIDMWISRACWETLTPTIPFERLPLPLRRAEHDYDSKWNAANYASLD